MTKKISASIDRIEGDYLICISDETSDNNVGTRIGIGLMYTFPHDNISGLIQYQYAPVGNELINNMSEFSVGFRYNF